MKKLTLISIALLIFLSSLLFSQEVSETLVNTIKSIEENEIRHSVENLYIKGLQIRDFELIKDICLPEARLMGINQNGQFNVTTLEKWSKRFNPNNPPFESLDYSILKIDREGTSAQVKVLFLVDSKNYITDFLHMLKIEGKWKIVNIIDF
jgi:hypothetical protein